MATAKGTVPIPAELQVSLGNLNDVIAQMRGLLKNVSKDSSAYKPLMTQITKLEQKALELKTVLNQPFTSQAEINAYSKAFTNLANSVQTTAVKMQGLNFDDLLFSDSELADVHAKEKDIEQAMQNITNLKNEFLKNMRSGEFSDIFKSAGVTDATNYEQAIQKVAAAIERAQQAAAKATEALKALQEAQKAAQKTMEETKARSTFVNEASEGKNTNFTAPNAEGKQSYKAGGREKLMAQMGELGFSTDVIKQLETLTAEKAKEYLSTLKTTMGNAATKAAKEYDTATEKVNKKQKEVNAANQTVTQGEQAYEKLKDYLNTDEIKQAQEIVDKFIQALKELQEQAAQSSSTVTGAGKAAVDAGKNIDTMREGIEQATEAMKRLSEQQKTLESIKRSVSNFLGFYQVLNLVKSAITSMISTVRELDAVMTQISIVTDMSQSDLWGQMETYSNLANQYGTSIKGVYEVSQLYYQQGKSDI